MTNSSTEETWIQILKSSKPGERFQNLYRKKHSKKPQSVVLSVLSFGFGILLIIAGILSGFTPILPGFLFSLIGAGILSLQSKKIARLFDQTELKIRKLWKKIRG